MAPNEIDPKNESKSDNTIPKWISKEYFVGICADSVKNFSKIMKIKAVPGSAIGENYASIILRVLIDCELTGE